MACAELPASLISIRCCRHLNGCPSELSRFLKKLTWYVDITPSPSLNISLLLANWGNTDSETLTWIKNDTAFELRRWGIRSLGLVSGSHQGSLRGRWSIAEVLEPPLLRPRQIAPRTVHHSLESHGSRCLAVAMT